MRLIKIINGSYGHHDRGRLVPKDRTSPAFEVADEEAARLVEMRIADYVDNAVATPAELPADKQPGENPSAEAEPENGAEEAVYQYDENSSMAELRAIAAERGIKLKAGIKKAELLELLNESGETIELDVSGDIV